MKNCHFALDMVFALADGTVVDVIEKSPCAADPCPSPSRAPAGHGVVELAARQATRGRPGRAPPLPQRAGR